MFALQAVLEQYLCKELAVWVKVFPDEFYEQIYRLRNWEWKGISVNRAQVVAFYTFGGAIAASTTEASLGFLLAVFLGCGFCFSFGFVILNNARAIKLSLVPQNSTLHQYPNRLRN